MRPSSKGSSGPETNQRSPLSLSQNLPLRDHPTLRTLRPETIILNATQLKMSVACTFISSSPRHPPFPPPDPPPRRPDRLSKLGPRTVSPSPYTEASRAVQGAFPKQSTMHATNTGHFSVVSRTKGLEIRIDEWYFRPRNISMLFTIETPLHRRILILIYNSELIMLWRRCASFIRF